MTDRQNDQAEPDGYKPIACGLFDYIELACVYGYELLITYRDGSSIKGVARNTRIEKGKGEFLQLHVDGEQIDVRLDSLSSIEPQDAGARFGYVSFISD